VAGGANLRSRHQLEAADGAVINQGQPACGADLIFFANRYMATRAKLLTTFTAESIVQKNELATGGAGVCVFFCRF
jgi:hypothetical protein